MGDSSVPAVVAGFQPAVEGGILPLGFRLTNSKIVLIWQGLS
jgi:hypothetical protein